MHDGMPYGRNQGQGHSREVDRQSPTGLIFAVLFLLINISFTFDVTSAGREAIRSNSSFECRIRSRDPGHAD